MTAESSTKQAENVGVINPAGNSKINITSAASLVLAIAASAGIAIPPQWRELALQVLSLVTPVVIMILRTWFTNRTASRTVLHKALTLKSEYGVNGDTAHPPDTKELP